MPADNPSIVLYVAVDNPKGIVQYGGTVAAPIAKSILESYIEIKNIPPTKEVMPKEYNWLDVKYQVLPDVLNKSVKGYKLEYSGTGSKVIYQSPESGYYVADGSTIKLMLGD